MTPMTLQAHRKKSKKIAAMKFYLTDRSKMALHAALRHGH